MKRWKFLAQKLAQQIPCLLILVAESHGSSPGRQGFKMVVAADETICGSIGGGIMEHKLVEKAKSLLQREEQKFIFQQQVHHKRAATNQSGLICSGEQSVLFIPFFTTTIVSQVLAAYEQAQPILLTIKPQAIECHALKTTQEISFQYQFTTSEDWIYQEWLPYQDTIHIIGAGHVGLALSRQMKLLNFRVKLYDDRTGLNTFQENDAATEKRIIDYAKIATEIPADPKAFVVIMSFGYRSDKLILRALYQHQFRYLGIMGSDYKLKQLYESYAEEGIPAAALAKIHAPVGLKIYSKTPAEIAVSIAAQIIQIKNKDLPGGRT
ncbi:MAG: XdhC family protein [Saprospiraceae bacterium]